MTTLDPDIPRRIKDAVTIYEVVSMYVRLHKSGSGQFKGLCPFHRERTPSFNVNPAKGIYYCFGCHKSGDVIGFIQEIESVTFHQACKTLADMAGISLDSATKTQAQEARYRRELAAREAIESKEFWAAVVCELWKRYRMADLLWCRIEAWVHSVDFDPDIEIDAATYACYVVQRDSMEALESIWNANPDDLLAAYRKLPRTDKEDNCGRVDDKLALIARLGALEC